MAANVRYSEWIWSQEHQRHYCGVYDTLTNTLIEYQWEGGRSQPVASSSQAPQTHQSAVPQAPSQPQGAGSHPSHHPPTSDPRSVPRSQPSNAEDEQRVYSYRSGTAAQHTGSTSPPASYVPVSSYSTSNTIPSQSHTTHTAAYKQPATASSQPLHTAHTQPPYGISRPSQPNTYTNLGQYSQTSYQPHVASGGDDRTPRRPPVGNRGRQHEEEVEEEEEEDEEEEEEDEEEKEEKLEVAVEGNIKYKKQRNLKTGFDGREEEYLDPSYKRVQPWSHKNFFVRGRVFMMLWSEPAGHSKPGGTRGSTHFSLVRFGESAYSEIRRFVVVRNKEQFSHCIPIQTYRRQGATKSGLIAKDHAVIHTSPYSPPLLVGEVGKVTKKAIRVIPSGNQILQPESRVNFGKPYAVEHNVKLLEIGMVADDHLHLLDTYFKQAMGL